MKADKGEIGEDFLEDLNFWRLSKNSNLQITPLSKPNPSEEDLQNASFAENDFIPKSLLDISQDKRLIAMGNTKGFSIISTTELYSKLRQADESTPQAYPSIWVHTKKGIPSFVKFLPDNESILVVIRSCILIYKISDIFENNHKTTPVKETDFKYESITKIAINNSAQNTRILVVFDKESVQLLDSELNYRLYTELKGTAVGFIEGDDDHFCVGGKNGIIKKYKMNGDEIFSFPLPIDIQTQKVELVEFQFISSEYMVSLHYTDEEDCYWFTFSVIKNDEIVYFSTDNMVFPPYEGSQLQQQFYINEVPNILQEDAKLFVLNFSCYSSAKFIKVDTKDVIKITDITPDENFTISHPIIEFCSDAESYPIGQILDLSVQGRIPNPNLDSDKDFPARPILVILNTYGQCYAYDVIYAPKLKDESYSYEMAKSIDYFVESNQEELSNIIWGDEIPENGFPEAMELSAPASPVSTTNELELEKKSEQDLVDDATKDATQNEAAKITSQLTKDSDYSLISGSDDAIDQDQALDSKCEPRATEKRPTTIGSIKGDVKTKPTAEFQDKPDNTPTKKVLPKVTSTFKPSESLVKFKHEQPPEHDDDDEEEEEEKEISQKPIKLEFEWPKLPTYPARPESPKLKETKEQVTSMIINLFKDRFNDKLKSTRISLNNSGEQIMNFRDNSLNSPISIGENELENVTQWKQYLKQLIESIKTKQSNYSEWVNQVANAFDGWKQLNRFHQHLLNEVKNGNQDSSVQLQELTPQQIREYSKMNDWNESCNHLVKQLEGLFAKLVDAQSDHEKIPTLEQIHMVINNIESSIQAVQNKSTSQLVRIEKLQAEIIQSNNRYLPHYFIPNQTSVSSNKESSLDSIQISEAGKKLAQQRKSKAAFNSQLLEVMRKHKPQWRRPMIKQHQALLNPSKQVPEPPLLHTFGSDEPQDEMFASVHSLITTSDSRSASGESHN